MDGIEHIGFSRSVVAHKAIYGFAEGQFGLVVVFKVNEGKGFEYEIVFFHRQGQR